MKNGFVLVIILLILSFTLTSNVKAGGTINVYFASSLDNQVHNALNRMGHLLTFVGDPANADVFVFNGVIPNDKTIAQRVQSGAVGLVLFLGPNIKPDQIQILIGTQEKIGLIQTKGPVFPQFVNHAALHEDEWLEGWMRDVDWSTTPKIADRYIISGQAFTPIIENSMDHSIILGYAPEYDASGPQHNYIFIFAPILDDTNIQLQNWKYFDYLVNILVANAVRSGVGSYAGFSTAFPAVAPTLVTASNKISLSIITTAFLLFVILVIVMLLLVRMKKRS